MSAPKNKADGAPHSWTFATWPATVYPNKAQSARYIYRTYKKALQAHSALSRIGRDIVFIGAGYAAWINSGMKDVDGYEVPCNDPKHAAKRNNGTHVGGAS